MGTGGRAGQRGSEDKPDGEKRARQSRTSEQSKIGDPEPPRGPGSSLGRGHQTGERESEGITCQGVPPTPLASVAVGRIGSVVSVAKGA